MHRILLVTCAVLVLLCDVPEVRAAGPRLELDPGWFAIVEPFRYEEARRFERGWNRGADAAVPSGAVRAPVDGMVRFAGDVAGRSVVTVGSVVDGLPVVVTLTGRWVPDVRPGTRIRRGDVLGAGSLVHVGMYDRARRSRYLPVVTSVRALPAGERGAGDRTTLSGAIAGRLEDAILGRRLSGGVPRSGVVALGGAQGEGVGLSTEVPPRFAPTQAPHGDSVDVDTARPAIQDQGRGAHAVAALTGRTWDAVELRVAATLLAGERQVVGSGARTDAVRAGGAVRMGGAVGDAVRMGAADIAGERSTHGFRSVDRARLARDRMHARSMRRRQDEESTTHHARGTSGPEVVAVSTPDAAPSVDEAVVADRVGVPGATEPETPSARIGAAGWRWAVAALALVAALLLGARIVRRRRHRSPRDIDHRTLVQGPFAPVVPSRPVVRLGAVHTDGSSIVPAPRPTSGTRALAWADTEAGTSRGTDPPSHAQERPRAPEHA